MNDIQENKYSTYLVVQDNLDDHAADYADHPKIVDAKTKLDQFIEDIEEADGRATEDITGVAEDKALEREGLEKICFKVAGAVHSYADDNNNRKLARKTKHSLSDFKAMRDGTIDVKAGHLKRLANPIIALLADYRLLPADLVTLETERQEFYNLIPETRDAIIDKEEAGSEVDEIMKKVDTLLLKVDGYVDSYRFEKPLVWDEYQKARSIVDNTGGGGGGGNGGGGGGNTYSGTVNPMSMNKVTQITYNPATPVTIEITGGVTLSFGLQDNGMPPMNWTPVNPGSPVNTTLGALGAKGNELVVQNNNPSPGSYKVTIG